MKNEQIGILFLAAGEGRRYGSNKLLETVDGRRMFEHALEAVKNLDCKKVIVTGYDDIEEYAGRLGMMTVRNDAPEEGISRSIRLGLERMLDCEAVIFSVCDQPKVTEKTFAELIEGYLHSGKGLASMAREDGTLGNPCIFNKKYYDELFELTGDTGGKKVIKKHLDDLAVIYGDSTELEDIDFRL